VEKTGKMCEVSNLFVASNLNQELSINLQIVLDKIYSTIKGNICLNTKKEEGLGITVLKERTHDATSY
jgi:hypothetical protein